MKYGKQLILFFKRFCTAVLVGTLFLTLSLEARRKNLEAGKKQSSIPSVPFTIPKKTNTGLHTLHTPVMEQPVVNPLTAMAKRTQSRTVSSEETDTSAIKQPPHVAAPDLFSHLSSTTPSPQETSTLAFPSPEEAPLQPILPLMSMNNVDEKETFEENSVPVMPPLPLPSTPPALAVQQPVKKAPSSSSSFASMRPQAPALPSPIEVPIYQGSSFSSNHTEVPLQKEEVFSPKSPLSLPPELPAPVDASTEKEKEQSEQYEVQNKEEKEPAVFTITESPPTAEKEEKTGSMPTDPRILQDLYGVEDNEPASIQLNFENLELKSFIDFIARQHDMNIIPDRSLATSKISLNLKTPVTRKGAWHIFLTVLETAGFTLVKVGEIYKIVPQKAKLAEQYPTFIGTDPETLPDSDATIRYVFFPHNISTQEVKPILSTMLGMPHLVVDHPHVNGMVIVDRSINIKAAMKVIKEFDQSDLQEAVYVMKLKRANASDVKALFDSLVNTQQRTRHPLSHLVKGNESSDYFSPSTKLIAEERTNSLIMLGNRQSLEKVQEFITNHIDIELKKTASPLRIYELQHAKAEDIATILQEVVNAGAQQSAIGQQAARYGAIRGGVKYFKSMNFQADTEGNRLLVSCTDDDDWALLKETIKSLDKAQPQVIINMMFVSINENDIKELGGQFRNPYHGQIGKHIDFQSHPIGSNSFEYSGGGFGSSSVPISLLGNLLSQVTGGTGSTLFSIGKTITGAGEGGLWAVFKALKQRTNATIISEPFITTTNRFTGTVQYGTTKRVETQKAIGSSGNLGGAIGTKQVEAMTNISITPQINFDGIIKLDVEIKASEFLDPSGTQTQQKEVKTVVSAGNGQVIALGGFVRTMVREAGGNTPFLSQIPILGWLAKNKKRETAKEYIFIFLSPTIIKPRSTPGVEPFTQLKLHQATDDIRRTAEMRNGRDPVYSWFFNPHKKEYSHKVIDFANARYQPTTVDLHNDPFYRSENENDNFKKLSIDEEAHSPQDYIREHKLALKMKQLAEENEQKYSKDSRDAHTYEELEALEAKITQKREELRKLAQQTSLLASLHLEKPQEIEKEAAPVAPLPSPQQNEATSPPLLRRNGIKRHNEPPVSARDHFKNFLTPPRHAVKEYDATV